MNDFSVAIFATDPKDGSHQRAWATNTPCGYTITLDSEQLLSHISVLLLSVATLLNFQTNLYYI